MLDLLQRLVSGTYTEKNVSIGEHWGIFTKTENTHETLKCRPSGCGNAGLCVQQFVRRLRSYYHHFHVTHILPYTKHTYFLFTDCILVANDVKKKKISILNGPSYT